MTRHWFIEITWLTGNKMLCECLSYRDGLKSLREKNEAIKKISLICETRTRKIITVKKMRKTG